MTDETIDAAEEVIDENKSGWVEGPVDVSTSPRPSNGCSKNYNCRLWESLSTPGSYSETQW